MSKETLGMVGSGIGMGLALVGVKYDIYLLIIVGFIAFSVGLRIGIGALIDRKIQSALNDKAKAN